MNTSRFIKELSEGVAVDIERSRRRAKAVAPGLTDTTEALARLVMEWPPRDVRLDTEYRGTHSVDDTSDLWVQDVVSAVRMREERRVPGEGIFVMAVDFPSNMAEYERFNSVAQEHNLKWQAAGCPEDKVDPWNGDVSDVEGFVDFARPSDDIPGLGDGGGPLDGKRPAPMRSKHVTVEYRAEESSEGWTLGFVARDMDGKALCWSEATGRDLAVLVRRSVQMLYGNHNVVGDEGPLSDGLPMLVQGRKSSLCEKRNTKPSWMSGAVKRGVSTEYVGAKVEETAGKVGFNLFGCWVPIATILGMLVWAGHCINQTWGDPQGPHAGMGWFMAGEAVLCLVLWASAAFATHALRTAEAAKMRSAYL